MVHGGHILLLTFPAQGHMNPSLQFAKRLVRLGLQVTFPTTVFAQRRISKTTALPEGLKFAAFSDGYDDGFQPGSDSTQHFLSEMRSRSSQALREIISASADEGRPITCLVYTPILPWAAEVARGCHVPTALLWIQPATVLDIYSYYFNGYEEVVAKNYNNPSWSIELPGLPPMASRDLPSFLLPSSSETYSFVLSTFKELMDTLDLEAHPRVLVNTFDALEPEALRAIEKYNLVGIGPLIPSAFLDGRDPSDISFGGDLFQKTSEYTQWLDSKPEKSVIYVSFGSILDLPVRQRDEIALGLLEISNRPFLWVIRAKDGGKERDWMVSLMERVEGKGMVVPWCSQLEVLSHPSLGCFVTHCGWNSTLESLASGVPVVAFPQWSDQGTNAKLIEDVWKTGVRVRPNEEGVVVGDEVARCVNAVMGDEELRRNAEKWRDLAKEAVKEGGTSDRNLKAFVEELGGGC